MDATGASTVLSLPASIDWRDWLTAELKARLDDIHRTADQHQRA